MESEAHPSHKRNESRSLPAQHLIQAERGQIIKQMLSGVYKVSERETRERACTEGEKRSAGGAKKLGGGESCGRAEECLTDLKNQQ